jgi:hypothetical protein
MSEPLEAGYVDRDVAVSGFKRRVKAAKESDGSNFLRTLVLQLVAADEAGKQGLAWRVRKFDEIDRRLAELEERIAAAKGFNLADVYYGVWQAGIYERGSLVTHGGSLWIALASTEGRPGETDDWQLCVKRGRDR